jgi:hypothetical protein
MRERFVESVIAAKQRGIDPLLPSRQLKVNVTRLASIVRVHRNTLHPCLAVTAKR